MPTIPARFPFLPRGASPCRPTPRSTASSAWAWSAAARGPSSAASTPPPPSSTTAPPSSPGHCRRDPAKAKASAPGLRHPRRPGLRLATRRWSTPRRSGRDKVDFVSRRHAEPHALRDRQGVRRGRLQRHLRQAADVRPGAGRGAAEGRREDRRRVRASRTTTPATRWSGRPARWCSTANSARSTPIRVVLHPGLAPHPAGERTTRSRPRGGPTRAKSGAAGCFGDIGTHAYNLGRYITGLLPEADLLPAEDVRARAGSSTTTASPSIRYENGALGTVTAVADQPRPRERPVHRGRRHEGGARVAPGGAEQDDRAEERRAAPDLHAGRRAVPRRRSRARRPACRAATRRRSSRRSPTSTPPPTTPWCQAGRRREVRDGDNTVYPNVYDGVEGMNFITQCVASSKENGAWLPFRHPKSRK